MAFSLARVEQEIWRNYPVGSKVERVERLLGRGALAPNERDQTRAITHNRQPGKCCDTGCTQPGQPITVPPPSMLRRD